jgi:hypothetical protein
MTINAFSCRYTRVFRVSSENLFISINPSYIFGKYVCMFQGFTLFATIFAGIYTLMMVSIER